jgi:uncharacterized protein (TIGR02421 family)
MISAEKERVRTISRMLAEAEKPVRILRAVSWDETVRPEFLRLGGEKLPVVRYPPFDAEPVLRKVDEARRLINGDSTVDAWLGRQAKSIELGALMLQARESDDFFRYSGELFGAPTAPLPDETSHSLDLARRFRDVLDNLAHVDLGAPPEACHLAEAVAEQIREAVLPFFGDDAPEIVVVDHLSANALAGPRRILIRRGACFTDKDAEQLINHEAFIHVATSLNGRAQEDLPILGASHGGVAKTQEGLAVFAEFVTGNIELDRLRRLADRVLAIQMAVDGADFVEVFRFFRERVGSDEQAFESARRVFRGGKLTGGAPFTKDIVYLDGLLRVHNFLRSAVVAGRADCLRLLFCGKLDIEDLPALCELTVAGLCRPPKFLPPWARDLRYLLGYLAYSSFLNSVDLGKINQHYQELFAAAPQVPMDNTSL